MHVSNASAPKQYRPDNTERINGTLLYNTPFHLDRLSNVLWEKNEFVDGTARDSNPDQPGILIELKKSGTAGAGNF